MKRALPLLTGLLLAGCVEYQSAPIDWEAEVAGLGKGPSTVSFSLEDVRLRALAFSPELNALRLAHATSEAKVAAAGYWDDPSLNLDVLRVLKEPKNPWIAGGSVSFTLPITGIPGLERRVAEAYSDADKWDVIAAEFATAAEAVTLAQTAQALQNLIAFLERDLRAATYRESREVSGRLVEAGEMSRTDFVQQAVAEQEIDQTLFELRNERLSAEAKLRRLTGVSPTCVFTWDEEERLPELATNAVTALDFIRAPRVRAALARYEAKEIDLKKEIRKQYPELSAGPAYTREDGYDRVGFTVGLTLPLWNRNRQGIAEAAGARKEGQQAAIIAWRDVLGEFAEAQQSLALVGSWEVKSSRAEAERLYEAGELSAGDYVACVQQDWAQHVSGMRRRIAALASIHQINTFIKSLEEK